MTAQPPAAPPHQQQGNVYDLAYKRYEGPRSGTAWRFLVIVRHAFWSQFRSRWVKALLVLGLLGLAITALITAFALMRASAAGALAAAAGANVADASTAIDQAVGGRIVEGPSFVGFLLILMGGAPAIASDLNAGAFQFYFARPVSRPQYLLARLLGNAAWPLVLALLTLVVLAGAQAVLAEPPTRALSVAARAIGPMVLRIVAVASVAAGVSSLTRRRGLAQALFAGIVVASFLVTGLVSRATHQPWVNALGLTGSAEALGAQALGDATLTGWHAAVPALACATWIAAFVALAGWRLARAEVVRG